MVKILILMVVFVLASCNPLSNGQQGSIKGEDYTPGIEAGKFPKKLEIVQGQGQSAQHGTTLPTLLKIKVLDNLGVAVSGVTVNWIVTAGEGSLSVSSSITNANGISTNALTLGNPGANAVTVTMDGTSTFVTFSALAVTSAFTSNWPFDIGTSGDYTFNSSLIEFSGGTARLLGTDQVDDDNNAGGFAGGLQVGVAFDTTHNFIRLGNAGACDGTQSNCNSESELNSRWAPQWGSLVAYWKMNGSGSISNGSNVNDYFNTSNATAIGGGSTYSPGRINQSIQFDGSSYISIPSTAPANVCSNMTVSTWVNWNATTNTNYGGIAGNWASCGPAGAWAIHQSSTSRSVHIVANTSGAGNQVLDSVATPFDGTWHHIAITLTSSGNLLLYIDGKLDTSRSVSIGAGVCGPSAPIKIGSADCNGIGQMNGKIDEFAIWSKVLTPQEIDTVYSRQSVKYSGTFTSRVMDSLSTGQSWTNLWWTPTLPFLKELPDYASGAIQNESSSDYSSLVGSTGSAGDDNLMSGIAGLWHFNEASWNGTVGEVKDKSGNALNGQRVGTATTTINGLLGSAGSFNGASSVSISTTTTPFANNFTIAAWGFPTSINANHSQIIDKELYQGWGFRFGLMGSAWTGTPGLPAFWSDESGGTLSLTSTSSVSLNQWHHFAVTYNSTTGIGRIFVDGILKNTATGRIIPPTLTGISIGSEWSGMLDEVAIWNRVLDPKEVLQLYRRGANRIKYQVRKCSTGDCSDDLIGANWKGPSGTNQTYFSELNNNTVALDGTGDVKKGLPSMLLSAFTNPVGTGRFFQYRAILESDDISMGCNYGTGATWCSPELKSVTVDPIHYDTSAPTIIGKNGVSYNSLSSFLAGLGSGGCPSGALYNLGTGATYATASWYWWNGSNWAGADGTTLKANTASDISNNISSFGSQVGTGIVFFKAFLPSSGSSPCVLDNVQLSGQQ